MTARPTVGLSGKDIWWLMKLTWITASNGHMVEDHWQTLKIPGLEHLFGKKGLITSDLCETVAGMQLPIKVREAASRKTGMVNAYRAYRNSLLTWCTENKNALREIISSAQKLGPNDQQRFDLAARISTLPPVPTPSGVRRMAAAYHITPLVACLDPKRRFPIINGESGVTLRLKQLGLSGETLEDKVRGFVGIIGQLGVVDAFNLDTSNAEIIGKIQKRSRNLIRGVKFDGNGTALPDLDDAERTAVLNSGSIIYRRRHNRMTTNLKALLPRLRMTQGDKQECRFDVLIANYDATGRDLLIEAKPDPDAGSLRVAVGQLLDYRRFLIGQAGTDLAILTIGRPPEIYLELLLDLQITALWFDGERCTELKGDGKVWKALRKQTQV
ncbi:MAG: hypothetical protein ACRYFU_00205 [Janthinobacterium lividum]